MAKKIIPAVKGTRDFYPDLMAVRTWLYRTLKEVSEAFGYLEYEGPILETLELYAAKSGEELVKQQSYVFEDRGGDMLTLRPELTPTLARMVAQKQKQLHFPLRWWSFGPFWRYERPQKGRLREFFQWNLDMLGVNSPEADAEMMAVIAHFFRKVGLTPDIVQIKVNNRRLMDAQFAAFDIPEAMRTRVSNWVDRRDKLSPADWQAYGREIGLQETQISALTAMLDDADLWQQSDELVRFFRAVDALGVRDYVTYEAGIVRGLLYYTGTVFEAQEVAGDIRRAVLGGGRYDNLLADVGGDPLSGVGFAMGDVVITLLLEKYNLLPEQLQAHPAPVLVGVFSADLLPASLSLSSELRAAGLNVTMYPEPAKLGKQFKYANRLGMRVVALIGEDEMQHNTVALKDMQRGEQVTVPRDEAAEKIREMLASQEAL